MNLTHLTNQRLHPLYFENLILPDVTITTKDNNNYTASAKNSQPVTVTTDEIYQAVEEHKWDREELFWLAERMETDSENPLSGSEQFQFGKKIAFFFLENQPTSTVLASKVFHQVASLFDQNVFVYKGFYVECLNRQEELHQRISLLTQACLENSLLTQHAKKHLGELVALSLVTDNGYTMHKQLEPLFLLEEKKQCASVTKEAVLNMMFLKVFTGTVLHNWEQNALIPHIIAGDKEAQASMGSALRILTRHPDINSIGPATASSYISLFRSLETDLTIFSECFAKVRDLFPLTIEASAAKVETIKSPTMIRGRASVKKTEALNRSHAPARHKSALNSSAQALSTSPISLTTSGKSPVEQSPPVIEPSLGSTPPSKEYPIPPLLNS